MTIEPGDAGYFVVPVTNDWTITDNYWDQQTSLNSAQAKPNTVDGNPDGTYTVVISKSDPQVYNWVSTGGLNQGTFSMRFQDLGHAAPTIVSSKVVKISELDDPGVLPPDTVYVTPAQRQEQIDAASPASTIGSRPSCRHRSVAARLLHEGCQFPQSTTLVQKWARR